MLHSDVGQDALTIICLLGTSRSGSTVLQRFIEVNSEVLALGELMRAQRFLAEDKQCGCGESLARCSFWSSALPRLRQAESFPGWRAAGGLYRFDLMRTAAAVVFKTPWLASRTEAMSAAATSEGLAALAQAHNCRVFFDSSKDPAQFLRLSLCSSINVVPVHLVRDPRGVAWSAVKRKEMDPMVMARHWSRLNAAITRLRRWTTALPWQVIRYEDFCQSPLAITRNVLSAAGVEAARVPVPRASHAIGGSPGFVLPDPEFIEIDENWKAEMPEAMQRRIMVAVRDQAQSLGYS